MSDHTPEDNNEEDISFEADTSAEEGSSFAAPDVKKLQKELAACKKERQEYLAGWQRERANYANYKQEEARRKEKAAQEATERMLLDFLQVVDSFQLAFSDAKKWEQVDPTWRKGVESIYAQCEQLLARYELESIAETGVQFDPAVHEAMSMIETDTAEQDDTVAQVVSRGYKRHDRVLRPAQVHVYKYQPNE